MHIGHYISGLGHAGVIVWVLFGGVFNTEPLPFEVAEVSVISGEEYAALVAAQQPPASQDVVETPQAPEPEQPDPVTPQPRPEPEPEPVRPEPPAPTPLAEPDPLPQPDPEPAPEPAPQPEPLPEPEPVVEPEPQQDEVALALPVTSPRPRPRPADRVAPEPVVQPAPEPEPTPEPQQETTPDEAAETPAPEHEASAPEEATTEIVTEAEEPSGAVGASPRPKTRPQRAAQPAPSEEPTQEPSENSGALASAIAEALGTSDTEAATPSGPPLSRGEQDALRVAVEQCWVVDVGSEAANVTVTVGMNMNQDGTVVASSLRMVASKGGSARAAEVAFQAARRAILRCQKTGYNLPTEKYDHWREIEMTFNPEKMRLR